MPSKITIICKLLLLLLFITKLCIGTDDEAPSDGTNKRTSLSNEFGHSSSAFDFEHGPPFLFQKSTEDDELMVLCRQMQNTAPLEEQPQHPIRKEQLEMFEFPPAEEITKEGFAVELWLLSEQIRQRSGQNEEMQSQQKEGRRSLGDKKRQKITERQRGENGEANGELQGQMVADHQKQQHGFLRGQTSGTTDTSGSWQNGVNWDKINAMVGLFVAQSSTRWHAVIGHISAQLHEEYKAKHHLLLAQTTEGGGIGINQLLFKGIEAEFEKRRNQLIMVGNVADTIDLAIAISTKIFWVSNAWDRQGMAQHFDAKMRRITCGLINVRPIGHILMQHIDAVHHALLLKMRGANATVSQADFWICMLKNFLHNVPLPPPLINGTPTKQLNLHTFIHFYRAMDRFCAVFEHPTIVEYRQIILRIIGRLGHYQQIASNDGFDQLKSEVCEETPQFP